MGSSCDSPEAEAQGVTQFVGTQELDSLVGRKASKPTCFSPSRIPFFRVSPCCDRRSQLTRGAFRFQFRKLRIWPAAFIGIFPAVDRPDMRRIFIEVRSFDPKLFAVRIDPLP